MGSRRIVRMSAAEEIRLGQLVVRFLVEGKDSSGSVAMFELDVPAGAKVPVAHSHDAYEETVYGLQGSVTLTVAGEKVEIGPGDSFCIKRGVVHRFDNLSGSHARGLVVITPGILGPQYFLEIAEVAKAAAGGPPDPKAIGAVMLRHGLTPAV
jgi:quercetin dioxygenase-like cupin family protein